MEDCLGGVQGNPVLRKFDKIPDGEACLQCPKNSDVSDSSKSKRTQPDPLFSKASCCILFMGTLAS